MENKSSTKTKLIFVFLAINLAFSIAIFYSAGTTKNQQTPVAGANQIPPTSAPTTSPTVAPVASQSPSRVPFTISAATPSVENRVAVNQAPVLLKHCFSFIYHDNLDKKLSLLFNEYGGQLKVISQEHRSGYVSYWEIPGNKKVDQEKLNRAKDLFKDSVFYFDGVNYNLIFPGVFDTALEAQANSNTLKQKYKPIYGEDLRQKYESLYYRQVFLANPNLAKAFELAIPGLVVKDCPVK